MVKALLNRLWPRPRRITCTFSQKSFEVKLNGTFVSGELYFAAQVYLETILQVMQKIDCDCDGCITSRRNLHAALHELGVTNVP